MKSDLDIAREVELAPIAAIGAKLGIPEAALRPYGRAIAKIEDEFLTGLAGRPDGKLILVTAISPTLAGEGKTTTTIGLGDALAQMGENVAICLREPSLGPCFGQKGGATGGGRAQIAPMEEINLHFTGDFHAITSAHNLLAAMVDNHVYWGNALDIDPRRIVWRRALDVNDRALREIVVGLGGAINGYAREDGFEITVASEVMAAFCLADDLADLEARLGRMIVAYTRTRTPVTARDLKAAGAMTALLQLAARPNLVQTLEGTPTLVHGGPFANIAHGCNSLIATRAALKLADIVVTEAGFGADLGAEKFFDIKCRIGGLTPAAAVVVATARALKMHGGLARNELGGEDLAALARGLVNLERHVANVRKYGLDVVVAVNRFSGDTEAELALIQDFSANVCGVKAVICDHWARGSAGAADLALAVAEMANASRLAFRPLYADATSLWEKTRIVAREIYGAEDIAAEARVRRQFDELQAAGYGDLPVCIAKTQYSFSPDPALLGAPSGFIAPIREVNLRAGAGFVLVLMGDIRTMPGLPRLPAAERIDVRGGLIEGLS
jgi:formate--tetrahydrofolate ligase